MEASVAHVALVVLEEVGTEGFLSCFVLYKHCGRLPLLLLILVKRSISVGIGSRFYDLAREYLMKLVLLKL